MKILCCDLENPRNISRSCFLKSIHFLFLFSFLFFKLLFGAVELITGLVLCRWGVNKNKKKLVGLQHGSVVSLAASSYYGHDQGLVVATQHGGSGGGNGVSGNGGPHSPGKYQENGHDTFSDFVTLVCQEAQNTQNAQVKRMKFKKKARENVWKIWNSIFKIRFRRDLRVAPWSFHPHLIMLPACYRPLRHR